jgi:hypothetical protein
MFFRIFYPCFLLLLLISSIVVSNARVEAVSAPSSMLIDYHRVCANVHEMGDMIFVCRYSLIYTSYPAETADQTFFMAITDVGGTVIVPRKLYEEGYGYNAQTLYLSAAEVVAKGIVWGGTYNMALFGNPTIVSVTPDVQLMTAGDWIGNPLTTTVAVGQTNLTTMIIYNSKQLELLDTTLDYVVDSAGTEKLTSSGAVFWQKRYPSLGELPNILSTSATYMTVDNMTYTGSYLDQLNITAPLITPGAIADVKAAFTDLGDAVGIPYWQVIAFAVLMIPSFMIISSTVYGISGNSKLAAIIAAPVMFVIAMLIPDALLLILTGVVAFIVVVVMWRFV